MFIITGGITPFIEDYIRQQQNPPKQYGLSLELEYNIRSSADKFHVYQRMVGIVCIGTERECIEYIRQQRVRKAIKAAEETFTDKDATVLDTARKCRRDYRQGQNPDFTR